MVRRVLKHPVTPWVTLAIGLVGAALIVLLLGIRTDFSAHTLGRILSSHFFGGTPYTLSIDHVEGDIVRELRVQGLRVRYRDRDISYDLLRVDELSCRFDLASILRGEPLIDEVILLRPLLRLKSDSTGHYIVPALRGGRGGASRFSIARLAVQRGALVVQKPRSAETVADISLEAVLQGSDRGVVFRIASGSARDETRSAAFSGVKGALTWQREFVQSAAGRLSKSRILLDSLAVTCNESRFVITGAVGTAPVSFDVSCAMRPLAVESMARVAGITTAHRGEVTGLIVARGSLRRMNLSGVLSGVLSGYALRSFSFEATVDSTGATFDRLGGSLNGAIVSGRGSYRFGDPQLLTLDLMVRGVNLAAGFPPSKKLPESDLNGAVDLTYRPDTGSLTFAADLGTGSFRAFPYETLTVHGSYAGGILAIDDLALASPTRTVHAYGTISDENRVKFFFDLACDRADTLFPYFSAADYRADVALSGVWEGTFDVWTLRANGDARSFVYRRARIPAAKVELAVEKGEDGYAVFFNLSGDSCLYAPLAFPGIDLSLEYRGEVTTIKRLRLTGDSLSANLGLTVAHEGRVLAIKVTELTIDAVGEEWTRGGDFTILIEDSTVTLQDLELHSRQGALYADGTVTGVHRSLDGAVTFERFGLCLINRAHLVDWPLDGKVRGRITVNGSARDPRLGVDLAVAAARIDTILIDTFRLKAAYGESRYVIDSLAVASPSGSIFGTGELTGAALGDLFRNPRGVLRTSSGDLAFSCRKLQIAPLASLLDTSSAASGMLSGDLTISDSLMHPVLSFQGRVEKLALGPLTLPPIDVKARVRDSVFAVEGILEASQSGGGSFHGVLPLERDSLFYRIDRVRPLAFELSIPAGDFAEVPAIIDRIAEGAGRYSLTAVVTGTVAAPHLNGDFKLSNGSFRFAGLEERYSLVNAHIMLRDSLIRIAALSGREGTKGKFSCAGSITLSGWRPSTYDLAATLDRFAVTSVPDVIAIVSGRLTVSTTEEGGRRLPLLAGSLKVEKAEAYYDLGSVSQSTGGPTLEPPAFLAAVDVNLPGDAWIKTPDARVELRGDVTAYHDQRGTYLRGNLDLVRGWYNVYNNKFRVTSGKLSFVRAGGFRPVVDIEAETRDPEGRSIYLTLEWHQEDVEPRLTLRHEDAAYSETDIWKMLGGGVVGSTGQDATWDARGTAQNIAANYIERVLNSQMEGVTIELETPATGTIASGTADLRETQIAVGKYLSQGLYVKYKQGLSISTARQIEVEYRISDLILLRSEIIRYSEKVLQGQSTRSTDEINVDVKLRWEF